MQKNLLFLFLATGSGHLTPARIVKKAFTKKYEDSKIFVLNGFGPKQFVSHSFFEKGYHLTSVLLPAAYSLFYELTQKPFMLNITRALCTWRTVPYLVKYIRNNDITEVVSFHFAVSPAVRSACRKISLERYRKTGIYKKIPVHIIVTDPYTAHRSWFLVKDALYIVFSEQLKKLAMKYQIPENKISIATFPIDRSFLQIEDSKILRERNGFLPDEKIVLITGGGEGLSNLNKILLFFAQKKVDYTFLVVCGRNKLSLYEAKKIQKKYPSFKMKVYSYINTMSDFINISDCVITKAGASTVMEILACRKPIIFCSYVHGQEVGNVRFCVQNKVGWFYRKPYGVFYQVEKLLGNQKYYECIKKNYDSLNMNFDNNSIINSL